MTTTTAATERVLTRYDELKKIRILDDDWVRPLFRCLVQALVEEHAARTASEGRGLKARLKARKRS